MPDPMVARLRSAIERAFDIVSNTTLARLGFEQAASVVPDELVPAPLDEWILPRLQYAREEAEAREPLDAGKVEKLLKGAWERSVSDVLSDFDPQPVANNLVTQVHRGTLAASGTDVAIKIVVPGTRELIRSDLAILDTAAALLGGILPGIRVAALSRELRERVLDELDLEFEASTQRQFQRALRRHETFVVPKVERDLITEDVLVSEWLDGRPLRALFDGGAGQAERDEIARGLIGFFAGGLAFGTVHADAHPDNVIVLGDGRLGFVDFGASAKVDTDRTEAVVAFLEAAPRRDVPRLAEVADRMGWTDGITEQEVEAALAEVDATSGPLLFEGPARLDVAALRRSADIGLGRLRNREGDVRALQSLLEKVSIPPIDLWPGRMAASLVGTLARLEPEGDWIAIVVEALRTGYSTGDD